MKAADTFHAWLKQNFGYVATASVALLTPTILTKVAQSFFSAGDWWKPWIPPVLNALAIFTIILLQKGPPQSYKNKDPAVFDAVDRFQRCWVGVWVSWLVAYVALAVTSFMYEPNNTPPLVDLVNNIIWYLALLFFTLCYVSLVSGEQREFDARRMKAIAIFCVILLLPVGLAIWQLTSNPGAESSAKNLADFYHNAIFGLITCVVFALLCGRIESRVIGAPLWVILGFYLYAGLQPISNLMIAIIPFLENEKELKAIAIHALDGIRIAGVLLKVGLYLLFAWLVESGVLMFYENWMFRSTKTSNGIGHDRKEYIKLLHQAFVPVKPELSISK